MYIVHLHSLIYIHFKKRQNKSMFTGYLKIRLLDTCWCRAIDWKRIQRNFLGRCKLLNLDCDISYTNLCICQNILNYGRSSLYFFMYELYRIKLIINEKLTCLHWFYYQVAVSVIKCWKDAMHIVAIAKYFVNFFSLEIQIATDEKMLNRISIIYAVCKVMLQQDTREKERERESKQSPGKNWIVWEQKWI